MAMPPQLKTIAILALDDAIIRLTQAKTSLTEAHSFLIFFLLSFIPYDTSAGALVEFNVPSRQLLKCHEDEAEKQRGEESDLLEFRVFLKSTNMSFAELRKLVSSSKMGASSQEASQTASSQAALPKGSPMADMEEVEDPAEPGTTE